MGTLYNNQDLETTVESGKRQTFCFYILLILFLN